MIVFIPSKSRPSTKTHKLFEGSGFSVIHFLEPQDFDSYDHKSKINIGANDMGITYVRNFMLDYAKKNGIKHFIVCDDDIQHFGVGKDGKAVKMPNADALLKPFEIFCKSEFAIGGINQRQFAWSEKKKYKVNNGRAECCVFINSQLVNWRYRDGTKEDRDFFMQCLDNRQNMIFFCRTYLNMPAIGSNSGGLHDMYVSKKDAIWAKKLASDWPKYCKIIEQYGRVDVRIDYKQKAKDMGLKVI